MQSGTGERDDVIVKLADELDRVTVEHDAAKRANSKLNRQQASADMPQVLDYVNQKSREFDLRLLVKNQERKVELAEMGAKRARLLLREAVAMGLPVALPPGMGGDGGGGGSPVRHARTGAH